MANEVSIPDPLPTSPISLTCPVCGAKPNEDCGVGTDGLEERTAALQAREELLKSFVTHVPAAVEMFDRDMRYLQVSERFCADYSVISSEILGVRTTKSSLISPNGGGSCTAVALPERH